MAALTERDRFIAMMEQFLASGMPGCVRLRRFHPSSAGKTNQVDSIKLLRHGLRCLYDNLQPHRKPVVVMPVGHTDEGLPMAYSWTTLARPELLDIAETYQVIGPLASTGIKSKSKVNYDK